MLIETSTSWGKSAVKGIVDYVRTSRPWIFSVDWHGVHEQLRLPASWRGDGIIARVTGKALARQIKSLQIPAVNVSWSRTPNSNVPQVITDEPAISRLAAEHFLERGFSNFAYVGNPDQPHYVDRCGAIFAEYISARHFSCWRFQARRIAEKSQQRLSRFSALARWLAKLPKPVAVFAWDAARGRLVTEACSKLGLRVPDDVAVLVGYDDELMCEISSPPLSGIDDCPERVGHTAAELLDRLMRGEKPPAKPQLILPLGVVVRQSTDTLAHGDQELTAALSFIREHRDKPICVGDVLKVVPLSRRSLELRFMQAIGRSPAQEIRRIHLQRAKELLIRSGLPISQIASASGFARAEVMTRAFRREFGRSPLAFRRQFGKR